MRRGLHGSNWLPVHRPAIVESGNYASRLKRMPSRTCAGSANDRPCAYHKDAVVPVSRTAGSATALCSRMRCSKPETEGPVMNVVPRADHSARVSHVMHNMDASM